MNEPVIPTQSTPGESTRPSVRPILLVLFGLPLVLIAAKWPPLPSSAFLVEHVSLASLPAGLQDDIAHILFVPLGAMLVVLVRLTLGLRVLGPFRSILLAVAFQVTGVLPGLVLLAATVAIVVAMRSPVRSLKLPYFGRITVMLSVVAVVMIAAVMIGQWFDVRSLQTIVYLPLVVLCLVADALARTMKDEGTRSAIWRAAMTALVAVMLALLAGVPMIAHALIHYPELLVAQIGGVIVISRLMAWRLLDRFNPKPPRRNKSEDRDADEPLVRAARPAKVLVTNADRRNAR